MSAQEFVIALIQSLIWPAVVLTIVVLFRGEIRGLLGRVESVSIGQFGAEFKKMVVTGAD